MTTPATDAGTRTADLVVDGLSKRFGGQVAVDGVSFTLPAGTLLGLIGPNGSGKTTTLNLINGAYRPDAGTIRVGGADVAGRRPAELVRRGLTRTFQTPHVFTTITAFENMMVPVLHESGHRSRFAGRAHELLDFVGLADHAHTPASELSGGQQKLLEFVRALMTDPAIVLMDEPFAGVHPSVKEVMRARITDVNDGGTSFVIVSHEIPELTRLCPSVICMSAGSIVASGSPAEVTSAPSVVEAYLGHAAGAGEAGADER